MKTNKDDYKYYLSLMHDQVKYAETKNTAVILFSGAFVIGLLNSSYSMEKLLNFNIFGYSVTFDYKIFAQCSFVLFVGFFLSIIISLISFLPKTNSRYLESLKTKNILFFDSNTEFKSGSELKIYFDNRYRIESCLILDYCNQIRNLSIIAKRKYKYFRYSLYPIFISFFIVIIVLIIRFLQGD